MLWKRVLRVAKLFFVLSVTGAKDLNYISRLENKDIVSDYCGYEKFSARCASDEIILVRRALFGRMQSGRCVTSEYSHAMGCYADVTSYIGGICSGKQNCSFLVATMDSVAQPCAKDFKSYLEATYRCVKVSFTDDCIHRNVTTLTQDIGYLALYPRQTAASKPSADALPLATTNPLKCFWLLSVESGRKIVVSWARIIPGQASTTNLNYVSSSEEGEKKSSCSVSLKFREPDEPDVTLWACQGHRNQQGTVFSSKRHRLEIHVNYNHEQIVQQSAWKRELWKAQVLQYAVFGCSDLDSTEGATVWRHADSAAIVCNYTGETWYLTCIDGEWTGDVGNCTKFAPRVLVASTAVYSSLDLKNGAMLAVLIGVAIGMLIGSLMLFAIILIKKSYNVRNLYESDDPAYGAHIRVLSHYHNNYSTLRGKDLPCSLRAPDFSQLPQYPLLRTATHTQPPPDIQMVADRGYEPGGPATPIPPIPPSLVNSLPSELCAVDVDSLCAGEVGLGLPDGGKELTDGDGCFVHPHPHPRVQHPHQMYALRMTSHSDDSSDADFGAKCNTVVCAMNCERQPQFCFCTPVSHPL